MLRPLALAAVVTIIAVTQASAGSACCACGTTCVVPGRFIPVVTVPDVVVYPVPVYVVNHGPVYTGPGVVTFPGYFDEHRPVEHYPYVATDFYYPHYRVRHGGYHRGVKRSHRASYRSYK